MGDLQSNAAGAAQAKQPNIVIKSNDAVQVACCDICGEVVRQDNPGPGLFSEGTMIPVCRTCGEKHAPGMVKALDELRKIEEQKRKDESDAKIKQELLKIYSTRQPQTLITYVWDSPDGYTHRQVYSLGNLEKISVGIQPGVEKTEIVLWLLQLAASLDRNGIADYPGPKPKFSSWKPATETDIDDDNDIFFRHTPNREPRPRRLTRNPFNRL